MSDRKTINLGNDFKGTIKTQTGGGVFFDVTTLSTLAAVTAGSLSDVAYCSDVTLIQSDGATVELDPNKVTLSRRPDSDTGEVDFVLAFADLFLESDGVTPQQIGDDEDLVISITADTPQGVTTEQYVFDVEDQSAPATTEISFSPATIGVGVVGTSGGTVVTETMVASSGNVVPFAVVVRLVTKEGTAHDVSGGVDFAQVSAPDSGPTDLIYVGGTVADSGILLDDSAVPYVLKVGDYLTFRVSVGTTEDPQTKRFIVPVVALFTTGIRIS